MDQRIKQELNQIDDIDKRILNDICSEDTKVVVNGLLSLAFYSSCRQQVENICIYFSENSNANIKGIAILCFGHLARIHGQLDLKKIMPIVKSNLDNQNVFIAGHAHSAKDDIETFLQTTS